jgi:hypothetical protein
LPGQSTIFRAGKKITQPGAGAAIVKVFEWRQNVPYGPYRRDRIKRSDRIAFGPVHQLSHSIRSALKEHPNAETALGRLLVSGSRINPKREYQA